MSEQAAITAHLDQLTADIARIRTEVGLTDRRIALWAMQLIQANGAEVLRRAVERGMCTEHMTVWAHEIERMGHVAAALAEGMG